MHDATKHSGGKPVLPSSTGKLRREALPRAACVLLLLSALTLSACSSKTEEEILSEANAMMQEQNLLKATILYKDFLEKFPESQYRLGAQMGLAEAYYRNREFDLCREVLDQVIEQNGGPGSPAGFQPFLTKLRTFTDEDRFPEALALAEATSDSLRNSPLPMKQAFQTFLGDLYTRNRRLDEALAMFQLVLQTDPPTVEDELFHLDMLNRCASIYELQGRLDVALAMFEQYIEERPRVQTLGQLHQSAGRIQQRLGKPEEAEAHFDQAEAKFTELMEGAENEENKLRYSIAIANLNYIRGRNDAADEALRDIIDNYPNSSSRAIALNMLADSLTRSGDYETAMGLLQQVVGEYPNTREAAQAVQQAQRIRAIRESDAMTTSTASPEVVGEPVAETEPPADEAAPAAPDESAGTP